jgi:hypothetical protein
VQQKGEDEGKKDEERKREQEEKREKRQRTGVVGACAGIRDAGVLSHGVASRRQASSVARRAPSQSHVTHHRAARAHAVRAVARLLRQLRAFPFILSFLSLSPLLLRGVAEPRKDSRKGSRSARRIEPRAYGLGISRSIAGLIDAVDERVVRVMGRLFQEYWITDRVYFATTNREARL